MSTKRVLIAMEEAHLAKLDYIATKEHRTRSDLMREAMRQYEENFCNKHDLEFRVRFCDGRGIEPRGYKAGAIRRGANPPSSPWYASGPGKAPEAEAIRRNDIETD